MTTPSIDSDVAVQTFPNNVEQIVPEITPTTVSEEPETKVDVEPPVVMTKEARLALMKTIWTRIKVSEQKTEVFVRSKTYDSDNGDEIIPVKKARGRPRKNAVQEQVTVKTENFNYDKLSDDAGVLHPREQDIEDELKQMATFI